MILHAKRILKTIEEGCMKCLRRRKKYLKQRIGQPLEASFKSEVRPFQYIQMDLTGRHVSSDGKDVYGLVCVCLQTYNTKIFGIESRKLEAVSLALEVLAQEVGPPDFIACDKEGSFVQFAKLLDENGIQKLEDKHQTQFKFIVPNAHFTTGLVERRMRMVHDFMGKLDMQGTGLMVAEIILMFQYVACKINNIPYGVKNIHTYSEDKIEKLRQNEELIMFIRPADWMLFQTPNGLDFRSIESTRGKAIRTTMDKLDTMKEFRKDEIFELLNNQYPNMELQVPKEVKVNSIVLIRNIGNENKREPLKFARVKSIKKSRDNAQRVVTLTYNNIKLNKKGDWIGTPVTVDRSVNDLILVDNALSDSMLGPRVKKDESQEIKDDNNDDGDGDDENEQEIKDDKTEKDDDDDNGNSNDNDALETEDDNIEEDNENADEDKGIVDVKNDVQKENSKENNGKNEPGNGVRRSARKKVQRITIEADDIGDCDTEKDPDYEE